MSTFPLPGSNWTYLHSPRLVAATPQAGFALQNGTPTILTWTAPNDGQNHRVSVFASAHVITAMTGGQVNGGFTTPDGGALAFTMVNAGQAAGNGFAFSYSSVIQAGSAFVIYQTSALTAGAATLWAEIWGS